MGSLFTSEQLCVFRDLANAAVPQIGREADRRGDRPQGSSSGRGGLAGQPLRIGSATANPPNTVLVIEKPEMLRLLREQHALSDRFIGYLPTRNVRIEEDLIDQLFNCAEMRLAPGVAAARALRRAGQTAADHPEGLPGDAP